MREGRGRTQRTRPDGRVFRDRGHGWCERSLEHEKHAHGDAFVVFKGMGRGGGSGGIEYKERAPMGSFFMTGVTAGVGDP